MSAESGRPDAEQLYEHAACGLLVTDVDGTIRLVNETFCRWIGYSRDELLGMRKLQDLLTMGGKIFHQTHWSPLLQLQGSVAEVKLDVLARDGQTVPMILNAVRRNDSGSVRHEIAAFVAKDRQRYEQEFVQARKRAEELLVKESEAQRALLAAQAELNLQRVSAEDRALFAEQMVGIVSHDLRNPLSTINLSADLLLRDELSARQRRVVEGIGRAVARSTRLIGDLLDFTQARIGGGIQVSPREIDVHAVVAQALDELRVAFPSAQIVHERTGAGASFADDDRLTQVLGNLVANAVAYGDPESGVSIVTTIEDDVFVVAVHNRGPVIPPDVLPTLFDAMTRGATPGAQHSVGLGLFVVREIAHAHGGVASAESSPDAGTTVSITLPRQSSRQTTP
ncbi:MAG: PAS domain-containing sensor histidine kinase [Pseudomonadota bacterium]|nr:PAS domain-containing sensor histidine kinase [Pseudomonadota bacterium]